MNGEGIYGSKMWRVTNESAAAGVYYTSAKASSDVYGIVPAYHALQHAVYHINDETRARFPSPVIIACNFSRQSLWNGCSFILSGMLMIYWDVGIVGC